MVVEIEPKDLDAFKDIFLFLIKKKMKRKESEIFLYLIIFPLIKCWWYRRVVVCELWVELDGGSPHSIISFYCIFVTCFLTFCAMLYVCSICLNFYFQKLSFLLLEMENCFFFLENNKNYTDNWKTSFTSL